MCGGSQATWGALQVVADPAKDFNCTNGGVPNTGWCQFWCDLSAFSVDFLMNHSMLMHIPWQGPHRRVRHEDKAGHPLGYLCQVSTKDGDVFLD